MSLVIGVGMGLLVFACIIISILTAKDTNKDDEEIVGQDSIASSTANNNAVQQNRKSPKNGSLQQIGESFILLICN